MKYIHKLKIALRRGIILSTLFSILTCLSINQIQPLDDITVDVNFNDGQLRGSGHKTRKYYVRPVRTVEWPDTGYWMLDAGCWFLDTWYWMLDTWMVNGEQWTENSARQTVNGRRAMVNHWRFTNNDSRILSGWLVNILLRYPQSSNSIYFSSAFCG